jgi:hypothetical protein
VPSSVLADFPLCTLQADVAMELQWAASHKALPATTASPHGALEDHALHRGRAGWLAGMPELEERAVGALRRSDLCGSLGVRVCVEEGMSGWPL